MLPLNRNVTARAHMNPGWLSVDLFLLARDQHGDISHVAQPVVFEPNEETGRMLEPLVRLPEEAAKQLAEDLWDAGVRPSQAKSRQDEINALQAHIADLQKLVFSMQDERIPKAVLEMLVKSATSSADRVLTPEAPGPDLR
jgi:hypothetical protein